MDTRQKYCARGPGHAPGALRCPGVPPPPRYGTCPAARVATALPGAAGIARTNAESRHDRAARAQSTLLRATFRARRRRRSASAPARGAAPSAVGRAGTGVARRRYDLTSGVGQPRRGNRGEPRHGAARRKKHRPGTSGRVARATQNAPRPLQAGGRHRPPPRLYRRAGAGATPPDRLKAARPSRDFGRARASQGQTELVCRLWSCALIPAKYPGVGGENPWPTVFTLHPDDFNPHGFKLLLRQHVSLLTVGERMRSSIDVDRRLGVAIEKIGSRTVQVYLSLVRQCMRVLMQVGDEGTLQLAVAGRQQALKLLLTRTSTGPRLSLGRTQLE